jgi:hypothetical protein
MAETRAKVKQPKQADVLIELASAAELFHDRDDVGYARFEVNGHNENWPIRGKGFRRWLMLSYCESVNSAPNSDAIATAISVLEAQAQFNSPEVDVRVRVNEKDGIIYLDLADPDWRAVEIDGDGWRVVSNPPVYFRRSAGMKPLPEPVAGGSLKDDLRPLCNVRDDKDFVLVIAWLLAALRPRGPYPILGATGEQGTAKSTFSNILRALVDPNAVPLRALPRNEHDVYISARNSHVLAVDNASGLPDWLSDAYCRLSTGGGFSTRELYSDQDEVLFGGKRPVLLNGIDDIATRPDLADRSIVLALAKIGDDRRREETKLWAEFDQKHGRILGALLDMVAHGIKTLPAVKLDRMPRMADFAAWATACEGGLWKPGTFISAYTANIHEAVEVVLDAEQVAAALRTYMDKTPGFEGTASDLLKALSDSIPEAQRKAKGWPKRPNALTRILRRIAPPLRKVGIDVAFDRDQHKRTISITLPLRERKTSSSPSSSAFSRNGNGFDPQQDRSDIVMGTVIGDDDTGSTANIVTDAVSDKPLMGNGNDATPHHDGVLHPLRGNGHGAPAASPDACAECGGSDGTQQMAIGGEGTIWLHHRCLNAYLGR